MFIVGSGWVGTAAKLGTGHVDLLAGGDGAVLSAASGRRHLLEPPHAARGRALSVGHVGFGELAGFVTAWNLWAFAILILATFGVMIATNLAYLVGSSASWLTGAAWYTPVVSSGGDRVHHVSRTVRARAGKWMQSIGGAAQLLTYVALLIVPFVALGAG
jgi:hypothetical protein